jgi:hypothetical protein
VVARHARSWPAHFRCPTVRIPSADHDCLVCNGFVIRFIEKTRKLLVERRMLLLPERPPRAPVAVLPCLFPAVHLDPQPSCRTHPHPSQDHRLPVPGPRPLRPSPPHPRPPVQRRSPARSRGLFRHLGRDRVAAHPRPSGCPPPTLQTSETPCGTRNGPVEASAASVHQGRKRRYRPPSSGTRHGRTCRRSSGPDGASVPRSLTAPR